MTNRELRQLFNGLTLLSGRTLPTIGSDLKVARLIRLVKPAYQATEDDRALILARFPAPEGEGVETPVAILEQREAAFRTEVLNKEAALTIPESAFLSQADLPKALKSNKGDENRAGLADILAAIAPVMSDFDELDEEPATEPEAA